MPIHLVGNGARLVLELFHHGLHGQQVLGFGPLLVHACDEVSGADVVQVIVEDVVSGNVALLVNHLVGVHLAVVQDVVAAIFKIGVQHALQFDAHHIAPLRLGGEVEHVALGHALHLRVGEPLRVVLVGRVGEHQRAVDEEVVVVDAAGQSYLMDGLVVYAVEVAVLDGDVIDGIGQLRVLVADNHHTVFRLLAGDILHRHVAHGGVESAAAHLARLVVGVDFQYGFLALPHGDVAHVDILDDAATARVGLDAQHAVERRRVHLAVLGIDILATAADFRADDHSAVPVVELTVADDDVLRCPSGKLALSALASVVVAPALDGYAVVAGVEVAVLYQYAVARLRVAAVAVRSVVVDVYAAHGNVGREQRVDDPERRAQQGDILDENALALVQVNHLRAQPVGRAVASLVHGNAVLGLLQQLGACALVLGYAAGLHAEALVAAPGPPCLVRAATVDGAPSGDGYVLGLVGIDERRQVPAVQSLPTGGHDGVQLRLEGKLQHGALFNDQIDPRLQLDSCGEEPLAGRNDDAPAAFLRTLVDGSLNGLLVLGSGVGRLGAVLGNHVVLLCKLRHTDALLNLLVLLLVPCVGGHGKCHDA